jgi:hypothetical protein
MRKLQAKLPILCVCAFLANYGQALSQEIWVESAQQKVEFFRVDMNAEYKRSKSPVILDSTSNGQNGVSGKNATIFTTSIDGRVNYFARMSTGVVVPISYIAEDSNSQGSNKAGGIGDVTVYHGILVVSQDEAGNYFPTLYVTGLVGLPTATDKSLGGRYFNAGGSVSV